MRKILIAANTMMIGGIENSLLSLLKTLNYEKIQVTLLLQGKNGELLDEVPKEVNIIEYTPLKSGNILKRKITNRLRYIKFILTNRYDCAICYASYIELPALIIRKVCHNNYMWVHTDYTIIYDNQELDTFIHQLGYPKYKNLVFVSEIAKNHYLDFYQNSKQTYHVCHNLIDGKYIKKQSEEVISYDKQCFTFLNVSRHDEPAKKISRLIKASENLANKGYQFKLLLIGDGKNHQEYQQLVKEKQLEKYIDFLGSLKNPYPYYKMADCFILCSEYEGGPITVYESLILKTPVITTDVGDVKKYVSEKNGIIIEKNVKSLIKAMADCIENKVKFQVDFDDKKYNAEAEKFLHSIIGDNNEV